MAEDRDPGCVEDVVKLKIDYYKRSGKFYSSEEYDTGVDDWHDSFDIIKSLFRASDCPGLRSGLNDFIAVVTDPEGLGRVYVGGDLW